MSLIPFCSLSPEIAMMDFTSPPDTRQRFVKKWASKCSFWLRYNAAREEVLRTVRVLTGIEHGSFIQRLITSRTKDAESPKKTLPSRAEVRQKKLAELQTVDEVNESQGAEHRHLSYSNEKWVYGDEADIVEGMHDLVGVRVGLYFLGQVKDMQSLIEEQLICKKVRTGQKTQSYGVIRID
jgi:hypothetical protein